MYYPTVIQPTSAGIWPNTYPISAPQQPGVYYQVPSLPTTTVPEVIIQQQQQPIPTVYYQAPSMPVPPIPTTTTSEMTVQQQPQVNSTTTSKTITTRILDPTTVSTITTTTAVVPPIETTTIHERPGNQPRGLRTLSASTSSDHTATSTESSITPPPETIKQSTILPPPVPIPTTTLAPVHRVIHRPYTPSGYYSSDLDYGRRKIYKTDYKYRHYYCCNWCKGRWDLHNRSYSCCEWFYGCPVWSLIFCGLLFLALLVAFFTLFGLQPSINPTRQAATAETRLLNRTQIIYGFYQNCGFQVNASAGTPTTLILCTNTPTTTTARIQKKIEKSFHRIIHIKQAEQILDQYYEYQQDVADKNRQIDELENQLSQSAVPIDRSAINDLIDKREITHRKIRMLNDLYEQALSYIEQRGIRHSI